MRLTRRRLSQLADSEHVTLLKFVLFLSTLRTLSRNLLALSNLHVTKFAFNATRPLLAFSREYTFLANESRVLKMDKLTLQTRVT